jgi:ATP-binding cassette subfamily B protein
MASKARTLWQLLAGQRSRYGLAVLATLAASGFRYLQPLVLWGMIDYVLDSKPVPRWFAGIWQAAGGQAFFREQFWIAPAAIVMVAIGGGVFAYYQGVLAADATERTTRKLRDRLYDHLQHLPTGFFDDRETGDLVQRCTSDVETVKTFLGRHVVEMARALTLLASSIPVLLILDWRMGLLSLAVVPVLICTSTWFFINVRNAFQKMDEAEGKMTATLQENISGIRVVRAFARQEHEIAKFSEHNRAYRDRWFHLTKVMSWFWPGTDFLCITQNGIIILVGGYFVINGWMTVGKLLFFFSVTNMVMWPIRQSGRILAELGKALVSIGRIGEILEAEEERDAPQAAEQVAEARPARGELDIEHLSFTHREDVDVLRDVSLKVAPGETLAIVGPSGAGKSTIIKLLLRLYDYAEGSIRLDGREISDLPRRYVRAQFGTVLQEPFLYSRSLRDNIKLGSNSAADRAMEEAATAAQIHESITGFEEGYDTLVGEKGVTLSGGQRQRVAIARALLKDPPILLLDDALSAVDTQTESMILGALRDRHNRKTTLVIAHRLTTLMQADRIIVLDEGRIVQSGTHDQLLGEEGMYARLWKIQTMLEDDLRATIGAGKETP